MMLWYPLYLLAAYGLAFGLQNKATFLRGKLKFLDAMLKCTYCTGFHAGWVTYLATIPLENAHPAPKLIPLIALIWAFASSAFSYSLDTAVRRLERA